jgi:TolB protein
MRKRIIDETGRDFLAQLSDAWRSLDADGSWSSYTSWHKTGRAIDTLMDYLSPDHRKRWLEVVLEPGGGEIYFRLYLYCAVQDGSQGMPLKTRPWDLTADARRALTGGRRKDMPNGYYVDLTDLMAQYGWLRIAAHDHPDFHWHTNFVATEYWHFQKTDGLLWYDALLEVYAPDDVYIYHNWLVLKEKGLPPWLASAKGIPIPKKEQNLLDMIAR